MLLFQDPLTLSATVGMLLIVAAGLAATLLRAVSHRRPKTASSIPPRFNPRPIVAPPRRGSASSRQRRFRGDCRTRPEPT